jgi:signal transduction histidine kinase
VVGAGGLVRSWNPAAERLTAVPAADAVGRPPPFPVPPAGQVTEHQLACGRWIQVETAALAGTDSLAVSLRPLIAATAVDSARDLFLAVASHELRTPVTVVRGYADTLIEHWDALDEPARREAVFILGQRARELARLVDRLLTAASDAAVIVGDDGGVPFELPDALREAIAELNPELRAAVHAELPQTLPKALGERASLVTVVTELVTNACKYSPNRVEVELNAGADAHTVWFRVLDRGVGIPPEHVERAFERFWQLDSSDQRRYGGVGLGLYLVRRIIERQHGWVSMRPRDGGGTVAEVRLPRADASPGEAES